MKLTNKEEWKKQTLTIKSIVLLPTKFELDEINEDGDAKAYIQPCLLEEAQLWSAYEIETEIVPDGIITSTKGWLHDFGTEEEGNEYIEGYEND